MRAIAVIAAALLLSSCAWLQREFAPPPLPPQPVTKPNPPPPPPPEVKPPHVPQPRAERPVPQVQNSTPAAAPPAAAPPQPDYSARCHEMANNRVNDAKQLGASPADQTKIQNDTYRDCMAQSVPALRP